LGGGKVVFPAGTYLAGITVSAPDVHLVLRPGAILRTPSASTHAITLASTAHRAGIFGGRIEGVATSNATTQWGIFTASQAAPNDVTVKGVTFSGADASHGLNNGVLLDGLGVSGIGLRWTLTRNRVERVWGSIPGTGYGFLLSRAWAADVSDNKFVFGGSGRGRHAIYLPLARHGRIIKNYIEECYDVNIVLADYDGTDGLPGCDRNLVALNMLKNGGFDSAAVSGIGLYGLARYNRISTNFIDGFKGRASIEVSKAATTQRPVSNTISNNEITNGDQFGINVQGALKTTISGGTIEDVSLLSSGTYAAIKVQQDNSATAADKTTIQGVTARGTTLRTGVSVDATAPAPTVTVIKDCHFPDFQTYPIESNGLSSLVVENNRYAADPMSGDRGDANVTLTATLSEEVQRFATTLTVNRTVTLSTTQAHKGAKFRVVRTGLGAFTLDVGGLKTIPSATAAFVDVAYDGTAWRLIGYGLL
jgi:hypothetical protein